MSLSRRALLSTLALAAPTPAFAQWPFGLGRRTPKVPAGRADYAGLPLRQQFGDWQFDQIRAAVSTRLQPVIRDGLEARFVQSLGALPGVEAAMAAVAEPGGAVWTHTWTREPGRPPTRFAWDGLVETYTATAVLQVAQAGEVGLDATIDRWAPGLPNARWITLEDLLAHTSGLPDAALATAAGLPPAFAPGAGWGASEANSALLRQILEATDQTPWAQALARRIAQRRDLVETDFGTVDGLVWASALDVVRFWRDLLGDRLHGREITGRRFYRLHPTGMAPGDYAGLGVRVRDLAAEGPSPADTWLFYEGAAPHAPAMVAYSMARRATVAVVLRGTGAADPVAQSLLNALPLA